MGIKYNVFGGYVFSRSDGDRHYIRPQQVMRLFGVDPRECLIEADTDELIPLCPKSDGDYTFPHPQQEDE